MVPYALLMGLLLPMATFFNIQSITVPSWVHLAWNNTLNDHASSPQPHGIFTLLVISWVSVGFGVLGTGALFVRMLERKIKWATRLMLLGAFCQGILASFACITLVVWALGPDNDGQLPVRYSEGIAFGLLGAMSSLTVACLGFYQLHLNKGQLYEWTLYQLSPSQRQVTLLLIATITYIVMGGLLYSSIEGWDFDDATYWAVVTFTTIGFGDLVPKTILGKLLLPIFAPIGVVLVAFNIYAVREVALELITLQLAEYFSKHFSSAGISPSSEDSIPHHPFRAPHRSYSTGMGLSHHHPHRHSDHRSTRFSRARSLSVDASSSSTSALDDTISSSAPSLFTDVHPSDGPSNLLVIPDPSSPVDDEQSPLLTPRRRRKLLRASTTSALLSSNEPRTLLLSRGANFPNLTITGDMTTLRRRLVVDVTQETFQRGITNALAVVLANTFFFGALFAYFEKWNF
ncbi:hypothetical protein BC829DRAFT_243023 [Chytridium lagenaria]|nr:hypothetical protein BC829DRAFT_243023 [Chytridium lagenaria]